MSNGWWIVSGVFIRFTPWTFMSSIPHIYLWLYLNELYTTWTHQYLRACFYNLYFMKFVAPYHRTQTSLNVACHKYISRAIYKHCG